VLRQSLERAVFCFHRTKSDRENTRPDAGMV
jgi:hypothetical protein